MSDKLKRLGECVTCGECCKKLRVTSVLSHILRQHGSIDEAKAYYSFRGIELVELDKVHDRILLQLDIPCNQLTKENTCLLHETPEKKPYICHRYPWYEDDVESCGFYFEKE